jgi:hypothetical protein
VREILAHAAARAQNLAGRGRHRGRSGLVLELGVDAAREIERGFEQRAARGEGNERVGRSAPRQI